MARDGDPKRGSKSKAPTKATPNPNEPPTTRSNPKQKSSAKRQLLIDSSEEEAMEPPPPPKKQQSSQTATSSRHSKSKGGQKNARAFTTSSASQSALTLSSTIELPLVLPPIQPTPYPFTTPLYFQDQAHQKNYEFILKEGKEALPTLFPDLDLLEDLEIEDEVVSKLSGCGLEVLFMDDPGYYQRVVEEFISSFEVVRDEKKRVWNWKFVLGGMPFDIKRSILCDWLEFPRHGIDLPNYSEHKQTKFWEKISGRKEWFISCYNATAIKEPVWKVIHRIISIGINARQDEGARVTIPDLKLMMAIDEGKSLDWCGILASRFETYVNKKKKVKGLGGGSLVTILALKCHFTFDHDTCPKPKKRMLDREAMKSMKFFEADQVTWAHHSEPWDNNTQERAKRKKKIFKERHQLVELTPTPPSSPIRSPPTAHSEPLGLSENPLPEPHAQVEPNVDSILLGRIG